METKFYRYVMDVRSRSESNYMLNDINIKLLKYNLIKETTKGYWIGDNMLSRKEDLRNTCTWISKTSKKRYAHPTEKEALNSFVLRYKKRCEFLKKDLFYAEIALQTAIIKQKNEEPVRIV